MKKNIFILGVILFCLQALQALEEQSHSEQHKVSPDWSLADIGTFTNAAKASRDIGEHTVTVGWNIVKIPFISLKHIILQFVDLACYSKNIVKHSAFTGISFLRLGTDVIAAPFVYGYNYPKEASIVIAALIAAGAIYEGTVLAQDFNASDWEAILEALPLCQQDIV